MDLKNIKTQFPIFKNHPDLVYLDSAASALKPEPVIDAIREYYEQYGVNVHRGIYDLSGLATDSYEAARTKVEKFINANPGEIFFTSGTTHGLNLLAQTLSADFGAGENVVLTRMEHHANLVPWQQMAKKYGFELRFIDITPEYTLDMDSAKKLIDENTKLVGFTLISNVLGTVLPVEDLVALAKTVGATTVVDAAQAVAHQKLDVKKLDCDLLVFSGHKLYGPTGIGVVYGKKSLLEELPPFFFGGDMIRSVSYDESTWAALPYKFEAGTPPIAEAIGLGAAIDFVENIGFEAIEAHERDVTLYSLEKLENEVKIIGPNTIANRVGVISFIVDGIHPHDVGDVLNSNNVAVRVGHHCAMPLMRLLGLPGTVRASFAVYNTKEDVDALVAGVQAVKKIFAK